MPIIDYKILSLDTRMGLPTAIKDFEYLVKEEVAKGWQPIGGITLSSYTTLLDTPTGLIKAHYLFQPLVMYGSE